LPPVYKFLNPTLDIWGMFIIKVVALSTFNFQSHNNGPTVTFMRMMKRNKYVRSDTDIENVSIEREKKNEEIMCADHFI
jgi:hypothetical protein